MGQAWCKEKSSKAQDSKSPLDRVFVRCAHRIYPGLKEEGSVLGGATQRVTSSEIGYAGSPPRAALLRGQSIDSVDRPFHPSEWVDVNLEVPCTPRSSVVLTEGGRINGQQHQQQRRGQSAMANGSRHRALDAAMTPVPPPRRRRHRERRPLPPEPDQGADEDSEPDPLYSKLTSPSKPVCRGNNGSSYSTATLDDDDDDEDDDDDDDEDRADGDGYPGDSDQEFVAIERTLQKGPPSEEAGEQQQQQQQEQEQPPAPRSHGATSLPNVARPQPREGGPASRTAGRVDEREEKEELMIAAGSPGLGAGAASLPRDASLASPQVPERPSLPDGSTPEQESSRGGERPGDNSIFQIDSSAASIGAEAVESSANCSLAFGAGLETSTPVKVEAGRAEAEAADEEAEAAAHRRLSGRSYARRLGGASGSLEDESSPSLDSSLQPVYRMMDADPAAAIPQPVGRNEDAGYESRSGDSRYLAEESVGGVSALLDDLSSGIIADTLLHSSVERPERAGARAPLQRTISEESLPREMLADELDEPEDEDRRGDEDASRSEGEASGRRPTAAERSGDSCDLTDTPSAPSPEAACRSRSSGVVDGPLKSSDPQETIDQMNGRPNEESPASMTPSLMELEAALTSMLEKKDEAEREAEEWRCKTANNDGKAKSPLVPIEGGGEPLVDLPERNKLDFPRSERTNPFNDLKSESYGFDNLSTEDRPEKPSRLQRLSLLEDVVILEPMIVPTPPRRRHRNKSNLHLNSLIPEAVHTYASHDRLI